jgi:hypothetical protein
VSQFVKETADIVVSKKKNCRAVLFWCLIKRLRSSALNAKLRENVV